MDIPEFTRPVQVVPGKVYLFIVDKQVIKDWLLELVGPGEGCIDKSELRRKINAI